MIQDHWRRISGLHCTEVGRIYAVWIAHNPDDDVTHVYDACVFPEGVELAVVAEGFNARGRNIPIAWKNKELADKLLERGCTMLYEPVSKTDEMAEIISREILERMRTGRFKIEKRLKEWLDEFASFNREEGKVPTDRPFMAATRYAIGELQYARSNRSIKKTISRKVAIV